MRSAVFTVVVLVALGVACSSTAPSAGGVADAGRLRDGGIATDGPTDAGDVTTIHEDAATPPPSDSGGFGDAGPDAAAACSVDGDLGTCITVSACAALTGYTSTPGYCPGAADIQCCAPTPNVADAISSCPRRTSRPR
jgi:hypothetical protein